MAKIEKLIERLLSRPVDFTWNELATILGYFGYHELKKGKTGGSRRKFGDDKKRLIIPHKPHPGNIVKRYAIEQIITTLKENGNLQDD